ncbi:hypothetical protein Tco_1204671 [Tanacetum coccineum]
MSNSHPAVVGSPHHRHYETCDNSGLRREPDVSFLWSAIVVTKEVTGWIPEFDDGKHNHSEDGSDNNSIPNGVNSDDEEVQDTFQSDVNVATPTSAQQTAEPHFHVKVFKECRALMLA